MALDVRSVFAAAGDLPARTPSPMAAAMQGSQILAIAGEVGTLRAAGAAVANFTIGDFDTSLFPVPQALVDGIKAKLDAGETNYPPAVGMPQLRAAIRSFYAERLGLDYPEGCVQVGSGARPPIYAAFRSILAPGDIVVHPVPTWNVRYYVHLNDAVGVPLVTKPENGFMPTLDDLLPHLQTARMIVLNSPLNPSGTVIDEDLLRPVCTAIVAENDRRAAAGERPLMLLYDQVYQQLVFDGYAHTTPVHLVPEMAKYTILVDAISKAWAATGVRLGWAVAPPWVIGRMKPLVGHMGAWAGRAEQLATADILANPALVDDYMTQFRGVLQARLRRLRDGLLAMKADGLPVDCLDAQGAIYLSARFDLDGLTVGGRTIASDEDVRSVLLHGAGVAVVPFTAFGYPEGTGWVRFSVGSVSDADVDGALARIRALLSA
ncbi:MAG: aspartate aminotransferase [Myxococcota bacterium]|jgi:aspartate aminotransferase